MVTFTPESLSSAGSNSLDFMKGLASDIVGNMKDLYRDFPRGFVPGDLGSAQANALRGFWDSFFGRVPNPDLPSPPTSPFTGGQCQCQSYRVDFQFLEETTGSPLQSSSFVQGPITGTFTNKLIPGSVPPRYENGVIGGDCQNGAYVGQKDYVLVSSSDKYRVGFINVFPQAGQTDSCGDPPSEYPSTGLPPSVNPREFVYSPPGGGSPVRIPYSIDFDPTVVVPIVKVDLNGEVEIPVSFDAGGINLDFNVGGGGDSGGISPADLEALLDAAGRIPDLQKKIDDLTRSGNQDVDAKGEQDGDTEESVPGITGVITNVTNIPLGYGRKFGNPQLFDFGRVAFKRGAFYTTPVPITYIRQWHPAPVDADGYAVTLNQGVLAEITVLKQQET